MNEKCEFNLFNICWAAAAAASCKLRSIEIRREPYTEQISVRAFFRSTFSLHEFTRHFDQNDLHKTKEKFILPFFETEKMI